MNKIISNTNINKIILYMTRNIQRCHLSTITFEPLTGNAGQCSYSHWKFCGRRCGSGTRPGEDGEGWTGGEDMGRGAGAAAVTVNAACCHLMKPSVCMTRGSTDPLEGTNRVGVVLLTTR